MSIKTDVVIGLLQVVAIIFVVITITYVAMKQLDRSLEELPTCFPPYFLMKDGPRHSCPTNGFTAVEDGLRPRAGRRPANLRTHQQETLQ